VNLPAGYTYSSIYAGIRKIEKDDLALIVSDRPAAAAAVFTTNQVCAAPVEIAKRNLRASRGSVRAILANAGNANCATRTGERVAIACVRAAAKAIGVKESQVLPASTGVIGVEMDAALIIGAMPRLVAGLDATRFEDAARAVLTTDTTVKMAFAKAGGAAIAGMTKGSGMIQPRMATTLGFVVTDAEIPPAALARALKRGIARSYNRISVDGDTSTNDMVAVLANGASGARPGARAFEDALREVLESLARQIARDGEGARKLVTIDVSGASNDGAAEKIARAIANSPLVKTAIAGSDPNWGRIICAAGYSGARFDPDRVDIRINDFFLCRKGLDAGFDEAAAKREMDVKEMTLRVDLHEGKASARMWTCDLTHAYIDINASYRT